VSYIVRVEQMGSAAPEREAKILAKDLLTRSAVITRELPRIQKMRTSEKISNGVYRKRSQSCTAPLPGGNTSSEGFMVGSSAVYPIIALLVRLAPINRRSQIDPATLPKEAKR
jgi:hypothetical protein